MPKEPEEIKGPDPKVWGDDTNRPKAVPQNEETVVDGVNVKGPDPEQWGGS